MTVIHRDPTDLADQMPPEVLDRIVQQSHDEWITTQLPEQEWCEDCAVGEDTKPGMPQDIVATSIEFVGHEERTVQYRVSHLACGHSLAQRIQETKR